LGEACARSGWWVHASVLMSREMEMRSAANVSQELVDTVQRNRG
jgi:hypothetical protein